MAKRQRRLGDVDTVVLSFYAKGLTTGEISAHFAGVTDASLSEDRVIEEMTDWCSRPLLAVYAAVFIDAIYVKVRDGQVSNRPFYAAIGVHLQGRRDRRDVLGLWAGSTGHGESAKYWMSVLAELKNGGVQDVFFIVCDGLKGPPDSASAVFPLAIVSLQHPPCPRHLPVRVPQVLGPHGQGHAPDLHRRPAAAAWIAFEEFEEKWAKPYPAVSGLWRDAWE